MSGNDDSVQSALQQLKGLSQSVKESSYVMESFGVGKFFNSNSGIGKIFVIEARLKV